MWCSNGLVVFGFFLDVFFEVGMKKNKFFIYYDVGVRV